MVQGYDSSVPSSLQTIPRRTSGLRTYTCVENSTIENPTFGINILRHQHWTWNAVPDFSAKEDNLRRAQGQSTVNDVTINHSRTVVTHIKAGQEFLTCVITMDLYILHVTKVKFLGVIINTDMTTKSQPDVIPVFSNNHLDLQRRMKPWSEFNPRKVCIISLPNYLSHYPGGSFSLSALGKTCMVKRELILLNSYWLRGFVHTRRLTCLNPLFPMLSSIREEIVPPAPS